MLKDPKSINSGSLVLLNGERWEVKNVFAKERDYQLEVVPATPGRHAHESHKPALKGHGSIYVRPDAMILTFPEILNEKQFAPVLDIVAKADMNPGQYRLAAVNKIDNHISNGASKEQVDALLQLRDDLLILTALKRDPYAVKKARDAALRVAADHQHDMATNSVYRAAAKQLESSPEVLVDRVVALEKALEDMLTCVAPHARDTGHNAADREKGEAIRNARKLLGK